MKLLLTLLLIAATSGCALQPVEAWQREHLAKPEMAWDTDPLETTLRTHTQVSKEASSGGASLPGGGCGCN